METNKKKESSGLSWSVWLTIWIAGMAGQLAWNIENQFFNTFVYEHIAPNPNIITWMVAVSAVVSTFATFFMGTLSDRFGKRKFFIVAGYIMWGISTIIFGLTQFFGGVAIMAVMVVIFDAIMSFFGSMGNDSGFNAWLTDISTPKNRGTLGTVIAIQPVIATIAGTVAFGAIVDGFKFLKVGNQTLDYFMLFLIVGVLIIAIGVSCIFLVKDEPSLHPKRDCSIGQSLKKPFNFKLLKESKLLLYVFLIFMAFFISFNIYFPHILNYYIYSCDSVPWLSKIIFGNEDAKTTLAGGIMALGLILGIPLVIISGKYLNKQKFIPILLISVIMNVVGLLIMFFGGLANVKQGAQIAVLIVGIFFVGTGYMGLYQALMTWVKNLYPEEMRSQFEGVRMLFYVCIPMFLGTLIGNIIITKLGNPIEITYATGKVSGFAPNHWLFIVAAGLAILTFIPIILAYLELKKNPPKYLSEEIPNTETTSEQNPA